MFGSNGIECGNCMEKADSLMGVRLKSLPNIVIVSLGRFEFNYETMDRAKIVSPLAFDLELDFGPYVSNETETQY